MSQEPEALPSATDKDEVDLLRQDIDRTQDALGGTIEAIQEKLNPAALITEARGPVKDTTDHIVAEVRRAVEESFDHIVAQSRGPVEEIGDHLIVKATTAAQEMTDHILERAHDTATETASSILEQTGQALHAATIGKVEKMASRIGETTRNMADGANESTKGFGGTVVQTIERNPLPAALAAIGLGWLYLKRPKNTSSFYAGTYSRGGQRMSTPANFANTKASAAGDAVGGTMGAAGGAVSDAASTIGSTVSDAASTVGDTVAGAASTAGSTVRDTAGTVGDAVVGAASSVGDTVVHVADGTQGVARNLVTEVQFQALRLGEGFQTLAQQNPLALGAAGLALGSLIGLAAPETQVEHQLMGGARDAVLDQAGATAQDALSRVGHVAAEAGKTVKQEAASEGLTS
jgi:hypothetical protein